VKSGDKITVEIIIEGSLEVKLPTIWTDEKQRWEESEKRREEKRREEKKKKKKKKEKKDQGRERVRRQKMQVREKVSNYVGLQRVEKEAR